MIRTVCKHKLPDTHCIVNKIPPPKFNVYMFKFNYFPYFRRGGGLYMEGVFRFKSWFLNAPGLIHGGAYRNFKVYYFPLLLIFTFSFNI